MKTTWYFEFENTRHQIYRSQQFESEAQAKQYLLDKNLSGWDMRVYHMTVNEKNETYMYRGW